MKLPPTDTTLPVGQVLRLVRVVTSHQPTGTLNLSQMNQIILSCFSYQWVVCVFMAGKLLDLKEVVGRKDLNLRPPGLEPATKTTQVAVLASLMSFRAALC